MIAEMKLNYRLSYKAYLGSLVLVSSAYIVIFYLYLKRYYYHYDDAFITYTFAKYWAQGFGFVFHPEFDPIQGSSSFLYTLILGFCSRMTGLEVHVAGAFFSVLSYLLMMLAFIALVSLSFPNMSNTAKVAVFVMSLFFQQPLLLSFGLETTFLNALLLWSIYAIVKKEKLLSALLLSLIVLTRLDYGFYWPLLFILLVSVYRQFITPVLLSIPCSSVAFLYMLFSKFYFGHYFPHTWIAKSYFPADVSGVLNWINFFRTHPFLALLAVLAVYLALRGNYGFSSLSKISPHSVIAILGSFGIWSLLYTLLLQFKKAPDMPWYYVSSLVFLYFSVSSNIVQIYHENKKWGLLLIFFVTSLNVTSSIHISTSFVRKTMNKRDHHDRRERVGLYLREHTPDIQEKSVLCYEIGKIAYYSEAKVYDTLGLVSKQAIQGLKSKDTTITLKAVSPDFVVGTAAQNYFPMMFLTDTFFQKNYISLHQIDDYTVWTKTYPQDLNNPDAWIN